MQNKITHFKNSETPQDGIRVLFCRFLDLKSTNNKDYEKGDRMVVLLLCSNCKRYWTYFLYLHENCIVNSKMDIRNYFYKDHATVHQDNYKNKNK